MESAMPDVSLTRLYVLRAMYLLIFVGQGLIQAPIILHHTSAMSFWHGIGSSMLLALALACALGIRYPLRMLPLLLFEMIWKAIWLLAIALPLRLGHAMDADTAESAPSILAGIIVPFVIPWRYAIAAWLKSPGDRWK